MTQLMFECELLMAEHAQALIHPAYTNLDTWSHEVPSPIWTPSWTPRIAFKYLLELLDPLLGDHMSKLPQCPYDQAQSLNRRLHAKKDPPHESFDSL